MNLFDIKQMLGLCHAWFCKQAASNYSTTGTNIGHWFGQKYTACPNCKTNELTSTCFVTPTMMEVSCQDMSPRHINVVDF
jgi:hypothetical protein